MPGYVRDPYSRTPTETVVEVPGLDHIRTDYN
jgi:hypothetical protein